jgi:hypothetical protein
VSVGIGSRGIVQRFGGTGQFIEGSVPQVGDMCILYPVADSDIPVCIPMTTFNMGDFVFLMPDFNFDFFIQPVGYDSPWVWDGEWTMNYGFYSPPGGYYLVQDLDEDRSGRFGVYITSGGNGVWSSISRQLNGTIGNIGLQFKVDATTAPDGKFTEIKVNGSTVYRKSAAESGMETWVTVNVGISPTVNPTLTIVCDCPIAYLGQFTLNIQNLSFS